MENINVLLYGLIVYSFSCNQNFRTHSDNENSNLGERPKSKTDPKFCPTSVIYCKLTSIDLCFTWSQNKIWSKNKFFRLFFMSCTSHITTWKKIFGSLKPTHTPVGVMATSTFVSIFVLLLYLVSMHGLKSKKKYNFKEVLKLTKNLTKLLRLLCYHLFIPTLIFIALTIYNHF